MKLEITHLAPYLPYGLKWKFDGEDLAHDIVGLDITNRGVKLVSPYNDYGDYEISSGKPLLLPMSSLYTEMEDGTVPIVELAKIATSELKYCNDLHWVVGGKKDKYATARKEEYDFAFDYDGVGAFWISQRDVYDGSCPEIEIYSQLSLFTYLFEHHFDVWNLIPQNLAIDKTKIK